MERINEWVVIPEPGEILDFEEVFDCALGEKGKKKINFGDRKQRDRFVNAVCLRVQVPSHTETTIRLNAGTDMDAMAGNRDFVVSEFPWMIADQAGEYGHTQHPYGGHMAGYISADGKDPLPNLRWGYDPLTGALKLVEGMQRAAYPPGGEMFITLTDTDGIDRIMAFEHIGTDDPDGGGEQAIAPQLPPGYVPAFWNGQAGVFIPNL